ncbi:hypothetical protein GCM10010171_23710 [Actinokineospora fastidiosa]|uniref:Uncharacterized protein n=1 Tax=Actinokineospora fastidiosa TaxID=1816 RepID=A0A918LCF9_9PSEU|nr:hypothetical protein GCM10010171_23710 [Actinokineospora fastidiosa]
MIDRTRGAAASCANFLRPAGESGVNPELTRSGVDLPMTGQAESDYPTGDRRGHAPGRTTVRTGPAFGPST